MKQHIRSKPRSKVQHKGSSPIETWVHNIPCVVECDPGYDGGAFTFPEESDQRGVFRIGIKDARWVQVLNIVYHEVFEAHMSDMGFSYHKDMTWARGSDCREFMLDHAGFTELCNRAASTIDQCIRGIYSAWEANLKKAHKKKRA